MNIYMAFFLGRTTKVEAITSYEAQQKAVLIFKPAKSKQHMVHVVLMEREDGSKVELSTASL